jgi:hypothetical protein
MLLLLLRSAVDTGLRIAVVEDSQHAMVSTTVTVVRVGGDYEWVQNSWGHRWVQPGWFQGAQWMEVEDALHALTSSVPVPYGQVQGLVVEDSLHVVRSYGVVGGVPFSGVPGHVGSIYSGIALGQSMMGDGSRLTEVGFWAANATAPGWMRASIYASEGVHGVDARAVGSPLASSAALATGSWGYAVAYVPFAVDFQTVEGTCYIVVAEEVPPVPADGYQRQFSVAIALIGGPYEGNACMLSVESGYICTSYAVSFAAYAGDVCVSGVSAMGVSVEDSLHPMTSTDVVVVPWVGVEGARHALVSDDVFVVQRPILYVEDALHAMTAGQVSVSQLHRAVVEDVLHELESSDVFVQVGVGPTGDRTVGRRYGVRHGSRRGVTRREV